MKTTTKSLRHLGAKKLHFVLDRGFYSKTNIDELLMHRHKFTISLPTGRKRVENILNAHCGRIASPRNYIMVGENEALYAQLKFTDGEKKIIAADYIFFIMPKERPVISTDWSEG